MKNARFPQLDRLAESDPARRWYGRGRRPDAGVLRTPAVDLVLKSGQEPYEQYPISSDNETDI